MDERDAKMSFVSGFVTCANCGCNYHCTKMEPTFCQIYSRPIGPDTTEQNIFMAEACDQWVANGLDRNSVVHPDHKYMYDEQYYRSDIFKNVESLYSLIGNEHCSDLTTRLRELSAKNKAPRDCIDEAADVIDLGYEYIQKLLMEIKQLKVEVDRLVSVLQKANEQTEYYERQYYLAVDKFELCTSSDKSNCKYCNKSSICEVHIR